MDSECRFSSRLQSRALKGTPSVVVHPAGLDSPLSAECVYLRA